MGTGGFLVVLAVAILISAQVLMMMRRGRPISRRLLDLNQGGDAIGLLLVAMLITGSGGAFVGSLGDSPSIGGAIGVVLALMLWAGAVVWAHRRTAAAPPPRHGRSGP